MISNFDVKDKENAVRMLELEERELELKDRITQLKAEPIIDEGCVGYCKVVDIAAGLQKKVDRLESDLAEHERYSDLQNRIDTNRQKKVDFLEEHAGVKDTIISLAKKRITEQKTTIEDLNSQLTEKRNRINTLHGLIRGLEAKIELLPDNFWSVVGRKDATIKQQKTTIEELKDRNIVDLHELCNLYMVELNHLKHVISARDLTIKSLTTTCQSSRTERNNLTSTIKDLEAKIESVRNGWLLSCDDVHALEAELSARKQDSEVLKNVVDAITRWNRSPIEPRRTICDIRMIIDDCVGNEKVPPETPIDEPEEPTTTFIFVELP